MSILLASPSGDCSSGVSWLRHRFGESPRREVLPSGNSSLMSSASSSSSTSLICCILDWLIVCTFTPRWLIIPGAEHIAMPKEYLYHFKGFLMESSFQCWEGLRSLLLCKFSYNL